MTSAEETGQVTGTKDKNYDLIWFTEACLTYRIRSTWVRLARAWEHQRADRSRFVPFFGSDLVVVQGKQAQDRLLAYKAEYFNRVPRPRVSPISEQLAAYAYQR